jgi:hypothetical protein
VVTAALVHHDPTAGATMIAHDRARRTAVIADDRTAVVVRVRGTDEQAEHRRNKKSASHAGEPSAGDMSDWWN